MVQASSAPIGSRSRRWREGPAPHARSGRDVEDASRRPPAPGPSTSNPSSWPTQSRPSSSRANARTFRTPARAAVGSGTTSPEASRWNRPPRVPIHRPPSTLSTSDMTIPGGLGTTGRKVNAEPLRSSTESPPVPPGPDTTRAIFQQDANLALCRRPLECHRLEELWRLFLQAPTVLCDASGKVEPGHAPIRRDPVRAIPGREQIGHPGVRKPVAGPISDELSPVEPAQAIDGAEPQEPARVAHDAPDPGVRKAVLNRVGTNRQLLSAGRGHGDDEHQEQRAQSTQHGAALLPRVGPLFYLCRKAEKSALTRLAAQPRSRSAPGPRRPAARARATAQWSARCRSSAPAAR